ncbi:acyltransferase family protein [Planctomonas deserti]|uniref:acyltransferase family protein n=1 Tax=Planctomonas deserti TaxID=2144185 RepID=UPI00131ED77C|nr:acyltransferase family protein [Planctomonas deserti]
MPGVPLCDGASGRRSEETTDARDPTRSGEPLSGRAGDERSTPPPERQGTASVRPRSAAIDTVRVLGLAAVVTGHAFAEPAVRATLYPWHVPVFFFLTGYLWTAGRGLGDEVRKRARTLLAPYLAWLLLAGLFTTALRAEAGRQPSPAVFGEMLLGGTYVESPLYTFWFATALIFAALLCRALERLPGWVPWAVASAGLAAVYAAPRIVADVPLSLGVAVPSLVFLLFGTVAKRLRPRIGRPLIVGLALLAAGGILVATGASRPVDLKQGDFGTILLSPVVAAVLSFGLVLVAEVVVPALGARFGRAMVLLASGGLLVMFVHPVVLWALRNDSANGSWVIYLTALLVPWAIAVGLRHTPLSPWLLGVPRARPAPAPARAA